MNTLCLLMKLTKHKSLKASGKYLMLFILVALSSFKSYGQQYDSSSFNQPLYIDEIVVRAQQEGFDIPSFIQLIKEDTTFYKAFRSLHLQTFNGFSDIKIYDRKGQKVIASEKREFKQIYRNRTRWMNTLSQETKGPFYKKNGQFNYYTAELFAALFYTQGKVRNENNIVKGQLETENLRGNTLQKNIAKLKILLFLPGHRVPGVPGVSNKTRIFDHPMSNYYHFSITSEEINGIPCFLFEAYPKKGYEKIVVIQEFKTWLSKNDHSIIARDYALAYSSMAFDFNVQMKVRLGKNKGTLLPEQIFYRGNWHIPTQKREIVRFTAKLYY